VKQAGGNDARNDTFPAPDRATTPLGSVIASCEGFPKVRHRPLAHQKAEAVKAD